MIETQINASNNQPTLSAGKPKKILRMVENERMGGSVPRWETAKTPADHIQHNFETALYDNAEGLGTKMAYAPGEIRPNEREFGFADLVDMVNPLQHIPVVGHIYREMTGDEIRPIGQIIGGALYGGLLGAASGLVNTIAVEETGNDLTGNALTIFNAPLTPEPIKLDHTPIYETAPNAIETPATHKPPQDLPGNMLSFVDLKAEPEIKIERMTSPQITNYDYPHIEKNPALKTREPITEVKLSGLYALAQ
jgi:hypothetical protein